MSSENALNYFEQKYSSLLEEGCSCDAASLEVIDAYLAGKPLRAKTAKKVNKAHLFWSSKFIWDFSIEVLGSDSFVLAISRYFTQNHTSNFTLMRHITKTSPEAVCKGIRQSEVVLRPQSDKWVEITELGKCLPDALIELIKVCESFQLAHKQRLTLLAECQKPFEELSIFEILTYSSLYAFKGFVEPNYSLDGEVISISAKFNALTKIVEWKLGRADTMSFKLTERRITESLKIHLSPIIFPSDEISVVSETLLYQFSELIQAQVELNEFLLRSVVPFCFDDDKSYSLNGTQLELTVLDDSGNRAWELNGIKINQLEGYWFNRGLNEFINLGMAEQQIGSKDYHQWNQTAYIKALGSALELNEIYGLDKTVSTDNGMSVDVFQALLSLELMIAFYNKDYIDVFFREYENTGKWQGALGMLAMGGLLDRSNSEFKDRFPITWLNWKQKAKNIVGWTISDVFPNGNLKAAEAILDFWTLDFKKWSCELKGDDNQKIPELSERPILKIGNYSVQLPWMMACQLTSVNAINNLRRFANTRPELKDETSRIEGRLAKSFRKRGFTVLASYMPYGCDSINPGEIDLICKLDDLVLVIEVKSTYRRNSQKEAIGYKNNALRKAGLQIKRKTDAVKYLLLTDNHFKSSLGIGENTHCTVIGWIADTCMEFDHEYFNDFLKVSVEELHIALNDDASLLMEMTEICGDDENDREAGSLYQKGFSVDSFVAVIESSKVRERILKKIK
ncbi:MAG: Holliday junction resolvase-like predicted endonuclease [Colwellia sp.]|jgi:Holliday junction resolvase-like predicted endonuclease